MAHMWQTPATDSFRSRGGDRKEEMGLDQQARLMWQTPHGMGNRDAAGKIGSGPGGEFAKQVNHWATPTARDWKSEESRPENGHTDNLSGQVYRLSRPDRETQQLGEKSSTSGPTSLQPSQRKKLNPLFTAWLMGWPIWWCSKEPTPYGNAATASYLSRQRWLLRRLLSGQ
jgi:DNA (cytosine-5)-methyltransferase 1